MTTTTSKLGADMTDGLLYKLWALALDTTESEFKQKAPAILARQPAAIDKEASNSPFSNCKFRECDLPGQCRSEGKCHHPRAASPAAPSVEQDERAVIVELLKRARYVRHDDLPAEAQKDAETRAAYGNSSAWQDARDHEQRRLINKAIERLEARAASTSANVAQGAEAVVDDLSMLVRQLAHSLRKAAPGNPLADRAVDYLKCKGFAGSPLRDAAPPAQTAITDDAREMLWSIVRRLERGYRTETCARELQALLTAAQSASGDDHAN